MHLTSEETQSWGVTLLAHPVFATIYSTRLLFIVKCLILFCTL